MTVSIKFGLMTKGFIEVEKWAVIWRVVIGRKRIECRSGIFGQLKFYCFNATNYIRANRPPEIYAVRNAMRINENVVVLRRKNDKSIVAQLSVWPPELKN
jgi:hypothetical protein